MILYNNGKVYNIDDSRISLMPLTVQENDKKLKIKQVYRVDVDGFEYMYGIAIYMEHKQYINFCEIYGSINIHEILPDYDKFFVCDVGVSDQSSDAVKFNDYTEKGREGVCYFSDVITEKDKQEEFKNNYINFEVKL